MNSVFKSTFDSNFYDFSTISLILYLNYSSYDWILHYTVPHLKHVTLVLIYWIFFKVNYSLLVLIALSLENGQPHHILEFLLYLLNSFVLVKFQSYPNLRSRCFLWCYSLFHVIFLQNDSLLCYAAMLSHLNDETFIIFMRVSFSMSLLASPHLLKLQKLHRTPR